MKIQFYHECFEYNDNFISLNSTSILLDAERIVCPICNGNGSHFRNDLDENDLIRSFNEDGDNDGFEAYQNGSFDQKCTECEGRNIVDVPIWNKAPKWISEAIQEYNEDKRLDAEIYRAECGYQW